MFLLREGCLETRLLVQLRLRALCYIESTVQSCEIIKRQTVTDKVLCYINYVQYYIPYTGYAPETAVQAYVAPSYDIVIDVN